MTRSREDARVSECANRESHRKQNADEHTSVIQEQKLTPLVVGDSAQELRRDITACSFTQRIRYIHSL